MTPERTPDEVIPPDPVDGGSLDGFDDPILKPVKCEPVGPDRPAKIRPPKAMFTEWLDEAERAHHGDAS